MIFKYIDIKYPIFVKTETTLSTCY